MHACSMLQGPVRKHEGRSRPETVVSRRGGGGSGMAAQFINAAPIHTFQSVTAHTLRACACNLNEKNQPTNNTQPATGPQDSGAVRTSTNQPTTTNSTACKQAMAFIHIISYRKNLQQIGGRGCRGKADFMAITDSLQPSGFGLDPMAMGQWPSTPLQIQQANGGISSNRHCKTKASDVNTFRLHLYHLSCKN